MEKRYTTRDALRLTGRAVGRTVRSDVPGSRRGVALLVVLVTVAVMAALSTEFAYNTRTNIWMAGNISAATQAFYHARSAYQIAELAVNAKNYFPQVKMGLAAFGKGREIWPQACEFTKIFCSGKASIFGLDMLDFTEEDAVGVEDGECGCEVIAEDGRVNLNAAATPPAVAGPNPPNLRGGALVGGQLNRAAMARAQRGRDTLGYQLFGMLEGLIHSGELDSEEEALDVVLNIMDWTDADETKTDVGQDGKFIDTGAAESVDYGRYGYEIKNAKFDTVGEVQLVEGVTTDIYCKIRDEVTVFAVDKVNVNDASLNVLKGLICQAYDDPALRELNCNPFTAPGGLLPLDAMLLDMDECRKIKKAAYSTPFVRKAEFTKWFTMYPAETGLVFAPPPLNLLNRHIDTRSKMVRIVATGKYRNTTRKISVVIDLATGAPIYYDTE